MSKGDTMDWKEVGLKLAAVGLPILGGAVGGPAGAAVGRIVAGVIGVANNPEEVAAAIEADPEARAKLVDLQQTHERELVRLQLAHEQAFQGQVNKTMRAEVQGEDPWTRRWRPFWGFTSAVAFFAQVMAVAYLMVTGNPEAGDMIEAIGSMSMFWSVPLAILGISAWHRGAMQVERVRAGGN